jgi:hypothetical protein
VDSTDPAGNGDVGAAVYDSANGAGVYGEVLCDEVGKDPNTKLQDPEKFQTPNSKNPNSKKHQSQKVWNIGMARLVLGSRTGDYDYDYDDDYETGT